MLNNGPSLNPAPPVPEAPPSPVPQRFWGFWPSLGIGFVIIFVFFLVSVIAVVVIGVILVFSTAGISNASSEIMDILESYLGLLISVSGIVGGIVGFLLIVAFIKARRGAGVMEYLAIKSMGWKAFLFIFIAIAVFVALSSVALNFFDVEEDTGLMSNAFRTSVWPALFWIAVVVFAPLFEEALFRGFLFEGFRRSHVGVVGAIFLTSIGWAILHFYYDVFAIGNIFVLGLILGVVRYKTGSLWAPMLMHAVNNAIATLGLAIS